MGDGLNVLLREQDAAMPPFVHVHPREPAPSPVALNDLLTSALADAPTSLFDSAPAKPVLPGPLASVAPDLDPTVCDPHAFAALYVRHRASFARLASRYLRDRRDIDEVLQEAFLRLFLALPELEHELQVLAYCRRTVTNLCIDRLRADQRRPALVVLGEAVVEELIDEADDPVVLAEDAVIVREALARLSPLHREALIKREIEEMPLEQIAQELEIAPDSVKHVLYRARRALRRLLAGTTAEPGIDLDSLGDRHHVARGWTAVVLVLAALGGGLGLRAASGGTPPVVAGDVGTGPQLVWLPPTAPANGSVPQPVTPAPRPQDSTPTPLVQTAPRHPSTGGSPVAPVLPAPAHVPSGSTIHDPATAPAPRPLAPRPVAPRPIAPASPLAQPMLVVVEGLDVQGTAAIRSQQRVMRAAGGTESASDVVASTPQGDYELTQALTFDAAGALVGVSLRESVPTASGTVEAQAEAVVSSAEVRSDGSVAVQATGVRRARAADVEGSRISVDLVLDGDRLHVLRQRVRIGPAGQNVVSGDAVSADPTGADPTAADAVPQDASGSATPVESAAPGECPVDVAPYPASAAVTDALATAPTACPDEPQKIFENTDDRVSGPSS